MQSVSPGRVMQLKQALIYVTILEGMNTENDSGTLSKVQAWLVGLGVFGAFIPTKWWTNKFYMKPYRAV